MKTLLEQSIETRIMMQEAYLEKLKDMMHRFTNDELKAELKGEIYATKNEVQYLNHLLILNK